MDSLVFNLQLANWGSVVLVRKHTRNFSVSLLVHHDSFRQEERDYLLTLDWLPKWLIEAGNMHQFMQNLAAHEIRHYINSIRYDFAICFQVPCDAKATQSGTIYTLTESWFRTVVAKDDNAIVCEALHKPAACVVCWGNARRCGWNIDFMIGTTSSINILAVAYFGQVGIRAVN